MLNSSELNEIIKMNEPRKTVNPYRLSKELFTTERAFYCGKKESAPFVDSSSAIIEEP